MDKADYWAKALELKASEGLAMLVKFGLAGPCALWRGQTGQVGNEAATAISRKCRRQGSPLFPCMAGRLSGRNASRSGSDQGPRSL